ncbi:MAG: hypothetical protein DMG50_15885 [Acidobacteria bacterium]|nr:MAG: hypothetical protein DMG50_15885 [Acidobacteriota bacterium]
MNRDEYCWATPATASSKLKSSVRDITGSAHDAIVVSAVIGMGKSLKHSMIAARVETPEQLTFLRARSFSRIEDNVQVRALQLRGNRWRS